jgi:LmbE family N-acetylglucosaminyl deacetylase
LKHLPREEVWRIREGEAREAAKILGLADLSFLRRSDWFVGEDIKGAAEALRPIFERERPELIYLPHPAEWHPDHKAALLLVRTALLGTAFPAPVLRTYEVWTPLTEYDVVQNVSSVMDDKLRAIRAHQSQLGGECDYERAATGLNQYRGALAGRCAYAEVFQTVDPAAGP